jgi:P pilus assembly chaperone PapD
MSREHLFGPLAIPTVHRFLLSVSHAAQSLSVFAVRRFAALCVLALATTLWATTAHAQLSIDRGELELRMSGDAQVRAGVLTVRNTTGERLQAQVALEDWDRGPDGGNRFHTYQSLSHSCGDALRVFPLTLNLGPGEAQPVRIEYTGAERSAECTSLVVVQQAPGSGPKKAGVNVTMRMALKVYALPVTSSAGGEITDIVVTRAATATDSTRVLVTYRNEGNRHVKATGRLEIRQEDNSLITSIDLPAVYALGGATMQVRAALPALAPGRYVLLAIYDYGGNDLAAGQLQYEVAK